ncbi:hypothetical protein [Agrobacterium rosae]|uniref:hypothetical protein n=1 Tax=Agrobacterium rosae TaxID=1972867 RepID=UPI002033589D|nr:hypothetical protein [Agrobacterium rosae]MCM2433221.1 hypothetical protein [Agrobacterium rosae]
MTDLISTDWKELDADNTSPSPNGVQGGYSPSQVAPVVRAIRGSLKRFYNQSNAVYTSTGTGAAYVLTFQAAPSGYSKGIVYRFWSHVSNTGAATLNVNTLGAKAIVSAVDGSALTAGQIVSGKMVEVVYNGTAFELISDMGQDSKLSGTLTITGNTVQTGTSTQTGNSTIAGLQTIRNAGEALRITSGDATSDPFISFSKTISSVETRQGYLQHLDGTTVGTTGFMINNDVSNTRLVLDNTASTDGLTFRVGTTNYNVWNTGNLPAPANSNIQVIAGNGILGGGTLAANRTFTLGTPSPVTINSTDAVTANSHSHSLVLTAANLNTIYGFTPANTTIVNSLSANVTSLTAQVAAIPANDVKAWVNFNGTGTVAIRASRNVSSITDNGQGDYTINFSTALSSSNYSMAGMTTSGNSGRGMIEIHSTAAKTASSCRIIVGAMSGVQAAQDYDNINATFFGG